MSGFLRNKVNYFINTDIYLAHHYHVYVEQMMNNPIRAYEADFSNKRQHIVSTIGEFFEREVLCDSMQIPYEWTEVISIITGEKRTIKISELIFKGKFTDSCGMASHVCAQEVLWKAYKEFFERQSYIANYLFKLEAKKIEIRNYGKSQEIDAYLKNYLDEIAYYDISLNHNLHVVLALGYASDSKAAGLGTSRNMELAVEKSQKEILQYYATSYNKEKRLYKTKEDIAHKDLYHRYFDGLSVNEVRQMYSYLENSQVMQFFKEDEAIQMTRSEIINENYEKLKMNPFISVFNGREELGVKAVKIIDFNWFPHMRPELYEAEKVEWLEKNFGWKRKNFDNWLPFA